MIRGKILTTVLTVSGLALTTTLSFNQPVKAQTVTYACANYQGKPTTVARTPQGEVPIISWVTPKGEKWTPQARCEEVSKRFQELKTQNKLTYLTTGVVNGQKVICAGKDKSCDQLLFTISDQSKDPNQVLQSLLDSRVNATSGPLIEKPGDGRIYLNLNNYVDNYFKPVSAIPTNTTAQTNSLVETPPVETPLVETPPSNGGFRW